MRTPLVVLLAALALTGRTFGADLDCPEPLFAAGEVRGGELLVHSFPVVNRSSEAVTIDRVKAGCGCIKVGIEPLTIPPGGTALFRMEVNTVTQAEGPNTWRGTVNYHGGDREYELPLFITAGLVPVVSISPAQLILQTETTLSHDFTLTERRPEPLALRAAGATVPGLRAAAGPPTRQADGTWVRTIHLEVLPDCPEGRHEGVLQLLTADPQFPELTVPVVVVKHAGQRVRALPSSVSVDGVKGRPLPARVVLLGSAGDETVRVVRVEADHPAIGCTFAPGPGPRVTLRVLVDPSRIEGDGLVGTVRVHLAGEEVVSVPVRCTLR